MLLLGIHNVWRKDSKAGSSLCAFNPYTRYSTRSDLGKWEWLRSCRRKGGVPAREHLRFLSKSNWYISKHLCCNMLLIVELGYFRIVLAVSSLYYMPLHPRTCSLLYSISCLLDALDGYAARYFEQSTRFGAVLDMVTDRCTTACLLVFLSSAFPRWSLLFQGLISLDMASHYIHMYATLVMGGENHKKVDPSRSWILNLYYTNKVCPAIEGMRSTILTSF